MLSAFPFDGKLDLDQPPTGTTHHDWPLPEFLVVLFADVEPLFPKFPRYQMHLVAGSSQTGSWRLDGCAAHSQVLFSMYHLVSYR